MIDNIALAIVVSVLFAAAMLFAVVRLTTSRSAIGRMNFGLHALMSAAMIVMAWSAGWQNTPQAFIFLAAAAWYLARIGVHVYRRHQLPILFDGYHAFMMLAMALMLGSMDDVATEHDGATGHGHMTQMNHASDVMIHEHSQLYAWFDPMGWTFVLAAIVWAALSIRRRVAVMPSRLRTQLTADGLYEVAMAAGMAIMFLAGH